MDCLRKEGIRLSHGAVKNLESKIELSIATFRKEKNCPSGTHREAHDALRALWKLSHQDDTPVAQVRARLQALPDRAVEFIEMRARQVIPELCRSSCGFLEWVKDAAPKTLVDAIRMVSADGAQSMSRSRGGGKRSSASPEPIIIGQARGAGNCARKGGRPNHDVQDRLVMHLAIDWTIVSGAKLSPGRSDRTGFGDIVHSVFQWLDEAAPDQALRRYWQAVKSTTHSS